MFTPLRKLLVIFFVTAIAAYISLPKELPIGTSNRKFVRRDLNVSLGKLNIHKNFDLVLGLDLAGGSHLVFDAKTDNLDEDSKKDALESLKQVIERRVNTFGIAEPNVQLSSFDGKNRVLVELPGVKDTKEAIELIGQTAQLSFGETGDEENPEFFKPTNLTGADLRKAKVGFDQRSGEPVVSLEFNEQGSQKFSELTGRNIGKPLPIFLDDNLLSAPIVNEQINGGSAQITGNFSLDEAKNLAIQLNAGALPLQIELVEERTIGATLGEESVARSVNAGLIGLAMVMLFMILLYGEFGFVADIALIVFGVITLSLYKLIPIVLTLPGIAGFLLSVGMAVDSNILIFERFKEEKDKHDFQDALEISFGRAWDSIRDANIATLVTAFILANPFDWSFLHISGPVRGFAITLALGIFISLFTGVVVTRNLLRVFVKGSKKVIN